MVYTYPSSNGVNTNAQAAVLDDPQATYSILYFDTDGICASIRNLFALGDATWKQLYPKVSDRQSLRSLSLSLSRSHCPLRLCLPHAHAHTLRTSFQLNCQLVALKIVFKCLLGLGEYGWIGQGVDALCRHARPLRAFSRWIRGNFQEGISSSSRKKKKKAMISHVSFIPSTFPLPPSYFLLLTFLLPLTDDPDRGGQEH